MKGKSEIPGIIILCIAILQILGCRWWLESPKKYIDNESLEQIAYSPDGEILAIAEGTSIWLYDASSLEEIGLLEGYNLMRSIVFSPDGKLLASGSGSHVLLWDVQTKKQVGILKGNDGLVHSIAFRPDGKLMASGGSDRKIHLWDVQSQKQVGVMEGHTDLVTSIAFKPDGKLLISGSMDETIRLWDVQKKKQVGMIGGQHILLDSVSLSTDGKLLALASSDNMIRLWDTGKQRLVGLIQGNILEPVFSIFSPDGNRLVFSGRDRKIHLWDIEEQKTIATLQGHKYKIHSLAFSPDGKTLASGDMGRTVRIWDLERNQQIGILPQRTQQGLSYYVGFDLQGLERLEKKDLQRAIKEHTGVKVKINYGELRPWWVARYQDQNKNTYWVLFEGYEGINNPDSSRIRIHLFDRDWKYYGFAKFTERWIYLTEARILREPVLGSDIIEVRSQYLRQVYAIIGTRVALIRLEDEKQNIVQNSYYGKTSGIGPSIPTRTVEQWQRSLDSENPCEVLETLAWLSGRHLPPEEKPFPDADQESIDDATLLFRTVRYSPLVKQKLPVLRESPNIWIQQAAEFALTADSIKGGA